MTTRTFYLFILSAAFLAELRCVSQKTTTGATLPTAGLINNSGDTSSKKDANQTYNSRLKRKNLSVDFAIPALLRNYLSVFIKRPLNGDCRNFNGCYTVRSNLRMHCIPLQKIVSSLLETNLAESDGLEKENITGSGQLPFRHKRPLSNVLNLGLARKTNQVVVEVGEELVRTLCGGLTSEDDAPLSFMELDLGSILEWWLGAEGGRLRVRIMPEKRAQVPGKEEKYSAAIRAADPRLFLEIASRGTAWASAAGRAPDGYWNFTWTAEDELSFPQEMTSSSSSSSSSEFRCHGNREPCRRPPDRSPKFSWSLMAAESSLEAGPDAVQRGTRLPGWEEGQFLWVNSSALGGPWVLSPWLWGGPRACGLDMAVFLHPQQSGRYTVWLALRDSPPLTLLSVDKPRRPGWAVLRLILGSQSSPFRISSGYGQPSERDTATFAPLFTTNCTLGTSPTPQIPLQGQYQCHQGPEIAMGQKCDFSADCPLGDDEGDMCRQFLNGTYCSFEDGDCGWRSVSPRGPKWRVVETQPGGATPSCPSSGAVMMVDSSHSKGQQGAASVRSPLFPPPLRNSRCEVRFWLCSGGSQWGALSLSLAENSTGPEKLRRLWHAGVEDDREPGWRLVAVPLYNLTDWFWLQFGTNSVSGRGSYFKLDNFSLSMDCFLTSNGEFPPVITNQNIRMTSSTQRNTSDNRISTPELLDHSSRWAFHTCGATGPEGPNRGQCANSYRSSNVNVSVVTEGPLKGVQVWSVPETRTYRITGCGAAGGRSVLANTRSHGVYMMADFLLQKDELLYILVGQQGEDACPNADRALNKICTDQTYNKTLGRPGGGGGGGGATYVFKMEKGVPVPLLIAAGGGGRGYQSSQSESQIEDLDRDPRVPGRNGRSGAAGGGGGWNDTLPVARGGRPLLLGSQGGQACQYGWPTRGGFGGGGGACSSGGGGGGYRGGSTPAENDPRKDGKDGSSFIGPDGVTFIEPLKGMESHGEVVIAPAQNCSHCESGECHETDEQTVCLCYEDLVLDQDGVSCINHTERNLLTPHLPLSKLALGLSVGTSALIAALLLAVSGVMIMYRRKHTELQAIQLELQSPDCKLSKLRASTIMTDYNPNYCFAGKTASVTDLKEVPRRNISLTRGLGHGAFGEVYEGLAVGIPGEPSPMQVAVKTLPEVCSEQDELDFLMEALIISKFSQQNIVRCIGVSLQALPRFILLELMAGGDLKSFLRETRPRLEQPSSLSMVDLLNVARDIARGCQYLEENQFIHRDIAARNCLLTCKGPSRVAKIGDFGMARDIYRASYYRKGGRAMLPVKWMPPEAFMEGIFTSKTDTWSFGVLLWEIFSLGYMPYPSRSNQEVLEFVTNGGRMDPPKNCPGPVYRIMTQCWQHQPEDRPNFSTILERIDYCLQDPDVVTVPLPVEYGPVQEEEERAPPLSEDPVAPSLLEPALSQEGKREAEPPLQPGHAPQPQPAAAPAAQPHPPHPHQHPHPSQAPPAAKPRPAQQGAEGGHVNLGFSQGQPPDKENRNGKPTNLWNPTYGSWFLQQQQQQQRQAGGRGPGEGQEHPAHAGRTVGEAAGALGLQHQHKQLQQLQLQQQQQQQGHCRLRRFPCGTVGYGYQEQGLPLESAATAPAPAPPPPAPPAPSGPQRPPAIGRAGAAVTEDNHFAEQTEAEAECVIDIHQGS
ncbi:ALK tyrosine kinase receptor [Anguilla anguilla]|uniref:ALK tyrosine kinase receptor n=1 Tax=Anguilla anguilla TaxID=7936 RepID=UPI0015B20789|nr:ALK tyrosine kinase receptor [Anguilla anguilla]